MILQNAYKPKTPIEKFNFKKPTKRQTLTSLIIILFIVPLQWYLSGGLLPLGLAKPGSRETRLELKRLFPGTSERAINSLMLRCYERNFWDTWGTYEEFIDRFENQSKVDQYISSNTCPPPYETEVLSEPPAIQ